MNLSLIKYIIVLTNQSLSLLAVPFSGGNRHSFYIGLAGGCKPLCDNVRPPGLIDPGSSTDRAIIYRAADSAELKITLF